ncbi:MAG: TraB/GumN family protein [Pseudomonadota bacterium]
MLNRRDFNSGLCALGLSAACRAETAARGPALWTVRQGRATVFLFGQMPVRTDTVWLTPRINAAFTSSAVLWLENPEFSQTTPEVMAAVNELNRRNAPEPGYTVLNALPANDVQRLRSVLAAEGMQPEALNGIPPRDVRLLLSNVADRRTGADFKSIPEALLRSRAKTAAKPVRTEWRDLLDIVSWSIDLPKTVGLDLVRMALDDIDGVKDYPTALRSWANGDLKFQEAAVRALARQYPELTRRLGSERNAAWVEKIRGMLAEGNTQFVCIGISHLVGPDGVPQLLRDAGLRVRGGSSS